MYNQLDEFNIKIPKFINYLIKNHNITNCIDKNRQHHKIYLPYFTCNDLNYFNGIIINPNSFFINLKKNNLCFILNKFDCLKIPLIQKYFEGTGQINPNYEIFDSKKKKFKPYDSEINQEDRGCILINIDIEIDVFKNIFDIIPYMLNFINQNGEICENIVNNILIDHIDYKLKQQINSEILLPQVHELLNFFGIIIKPNEYSPV